jgi:hypothetical protein
MAHFAELNENNIVTQVITVNNNELLDNGVESESKGIAFCKSLFGGNWVQTSYNGSIRFNYAGIGYSYDKELDAFIAPKPFDSWVLDETTCSWIPPIQRPNNDFSLIWDEENLEWQESKN